MSQPLALIPILTLVLLSAGAALHMRRDLRQGTLTRPSTFCWLAVVGVALIAAVVWCATGLYTGGPAELACLAAAAALSGTLILTRKTIGEKIGGALERSGMPAWLRAALPAAAVLIVCTALGFLAVELPYNSYVPWMDPRCVLIQMLVILMSLTFLYLLCQRRGAGILLGVILCFVIGLAQFFVASFKSAAILPNDLFALGTAAAVSGSYVYAINGWVLLGLSCVLLAVGTCSLLLPPTPAPANGRAQRTVANLAGAAIAFALLWSGVTVPNYFDDLDVGMEYWYSLDYYRKQGFITSFIAVAQDLPIDVPEGYTSAGAQKLEDAYVATYDETLGASPERSAAEQQFEEIKPSVVCIMNESFSDLSVLDGERWGYAGPQRYKATADALSGGSLAVSVIGGGTCNSEFEFLTGVPLVYVGDGKYPYSIYDLSEAPSLAKQFSELGYKTTAMHPNYASNWNRDRVYEALGFDRFLSIDDFEGCEYYHSGVSDAATYDKVLELLASDDSPQLIFDVTMQNHSGYDQNNIGVVPQYSVEGMTDYDNARLSEYVACIEESDRALAEFLEELRSLDRPVVVVFFGDHQPALSIDVSNALYPNEEDGLAHNRRMYQTTYLIWANYDVAGNAQTSEKDDSSPAYLAAMMAEMVGAPLTDFQKAQLVAREEMPVLSLLGARDPEGTWSSKNEPFAMPGAYVDLAQITYLEFASKL